MDIVPLLDGMHSFLQVLLVKRVFLFLFLGSVLVKLMHVLDKSPSVPVLLFLKTFISFILICFKFLSNLKEFGLEL